MKKTIFIYLYRIKIKLETLFLKEIVKVPLLLKKRYQLVINAPLKNLK